MRTTRPQIDRNGRKSVNSKAEDLRKGQVKLSPNASQLNPTCQTSTSKRRRPSETPSRQPLAPVVNSSPPCNISKTKSPAPLQPYMSGGRSQSLSKSTPSSPRVTTTAVFKRVPETDPDRTAALWANIRATKTPAMAPWLKNSKDQSGQKRGTGKGAKRTAPQPDDLDWSSGLHGADAEELNDVRSVPQSHLDLDFEGTATTTNTKATRITARSTSFEECVLRPRKLLMDRENATKTNPYIHFGVDHPPRGQAAINYHTIEGLEAAKIWISLGDDSIKEIIEEYEFMDRYRMCEEEYAAFATEIFLKRKRRVCKIPSDRKWRAERMLQLVAPPKGPFWAAPTSFAEEPDDFAFNSRPDCSYWLSLAGFNEDYRSELGDAAYVQNDWITCPYFTVEFKKTGQSITQATNQAAAASSLALYNRYLLKKKALKVTGGMWTELDKAQMLHYALTFVGREYTIWVLQACLSETNDWDGCSGRSLYNSKCTSKYAVKQLMGWINEIHRWGLSQHAASCQLDVKGILEHDLGVDVSGIDLVD
ncbi:hypothetical protein MMC30_005747 [Trapelia coarctata]|nr:hypothetical protein [Trapelia coarctata]